jgi:hypothetical protein
VLALLLVGAMHAQEKLEEESNPGVGPSAPLERFRRMPPAQRERLLQRLPPARRERVERQLRELDRMSPEDMRRLRRQYEVFQQLPPERQNEFRKLFRRFNELPSDRRQAIRSEIADLRRLTPRERRLRVESDAFQDRFSLDEKQLMRRMYRVMTEINEPDLP